MTHSVSSFRSPAPLARRPRLWRRLTRPLWTRPVRASGALLIACVLTAPAQADTVTWIGGNSDWHATFASPPTNWSNGAFPGPTDDARNNTLFTITHSFGSDTINSFLSTGVLNLTGGSINANTTTSAFNVNNTFNLAGGTLNGFVVGGQGITVANNGNNRLNGVTINSALDLSTNGSSFVQVDGNGMILNGTATLDNGGRLFSNADQTFRGTGAIVFGANGGTLYTPNGTLTTGTGLTIRGQNGTIQASLINGGLISADVAGGTITVYGSNVTNNAIMQARSGGTLALTSDTVNNGASGIFIAQTGSVISVDGTTINGGVENGTGALRFTNNGNNRLNGATVNGILDLSTNSSSFLQVDSGGLTVNGTANLDNGGRLFSNANQTFGGTGSIVFGANGATIYTPNGTLITGNGLTIRGQNGTIQANLVNGGLITSDSGGTITVTNSNVTNNATMRAVSGSTLALTSDVITNTNGTLDTAAGGLITVDNTTINGGTVTGSGNLRFTNNGNNRLNGVTVNSLLDLSTNASSFLQVDGGNLTLNNTANLDNGGRLYSNADQTFGGNGSIVFGASGAVNGGLLYTPNGTLTLGNNLTVRGKTGTIQGNFINNGLITSDVNGGTILVTNSNVTNNATMRAANGATLVLLSDLITNTSRTLDTATSGLISVDNTTINGGTVAGSGTLRFTNNGNNRLNGVTVNSALDLSTNGSSFLQVDGGGLTINGTATLDNGGRLYSNADQTFGGTGSIVFGANGGSLLYTPNGTLTLASGLTVRGTSGTLQGNFINGGLITSDSGGTITVTNSNVANNNVMRATNGSTLALTSDLITNTNGTLNTAAGGLITVDNTTINGGTVTGSGNLRFTNNGNNRLNGVTVNSLLDLSTNSSAFLQVDGGNLTLNNTANLDNGGRLYSNANQTFGGTGSIVFGANGSNLLYTPNGVLTLGSGLTVRGTSGTIQGSFINNGLISADVNGGTILVTNSNVTNASVMRAANGATLALTSDLITNNGTLNAQTGSVISADNTTINGGLETGAGALRFTNNGSNRMNGVTVNGLLDLSTNANSFLQVDANGLTVNGTANLDNGGRLYSNADQTFGGTGNIVFGANGSNLLYTPNGTLTTGSGLTIRGQNGTIQANLVNGGRISADVAGGTITSTNGFSSSGTLEAKNGGNLTINGSVTSSGVVHTGAGSQIRMNSLTQSAGSTQSDGTLTLNNGNGALVVNGGTLFGTGTVQGSVTINSGATIKPGDSPGVLTITGPYTQASGGMFLEELGGRTPGSQYGQLNVSGLATLGSGSILDVMFDGGFAPIVGDRFDILNYGSLTGTFGSIVSFTPGYAFSFADDGSGKHGFLQITQAPAIAPSVPEPGTWAMLGAGMMSGLAFYRRRRAQA